MFYERWALCAAFQQVNGRYHIGVDVGLPVERPLGLEVLCCSVELEEARLRDEDASVPLLEYLLGGDSFKHHSAEEVVHDEERRKGCHSSRSSFLLDCTVDLLR